MPHWHFLKILDKDVGKIWVHAFTVDTMASQLLSSHFETKYLIDISIDEISKIESMKLANLRYSFKEDRAILIVYNGEDKERIVKNINITGLQQKHIEVEDIYYKVMNSEK